MSRRPRLVHEGSPIMNEGESSGSSHPSSVAASSWSDDGGARNTRVVNDSQHVKNNLAGYAAAATEKRTTSSSKPYKLQTRLVVGEGSTNEEENDLDMMMDDDDEDHHDQPCQPNQYVSTYSNSNWGGYVGQHGHQHHGHNNGHHGQNQQYNNMERTMPPAAAHRLQQQQMHLTNSEFYNNGHNFVPTHQIHHAPPSNQPNQPNPPPPILHHHHHNNNIPLLTPSIPTSPITTSPLVVLDAANIAYNYAESLNPSYQTNQQRRIQPNPRGIRLAINYFVKSGNCRVQAVVPISWYQLKPRPTDVHHLQNKNNASDAKMITEEVEELRNLRVQGFLVACPPGDDDDAYVLALARREEDRILLEQQQQQQQDESMGMEEDDVPSQLPQQNLPKTVLGGYVVSNDFFNDAIRREENKHTNDPLHWRPTNSLRSWLKKNRISYSFANVGTSGMNGEKRLEFLPNPRNELIETMDACNRLTNCGMR